MHIYIDICLYQYTIYDYIINNANQYLCLAVSDQGAFRPEEAWASRCAAASRGPASPEAPTSCRCDISGDFPGDFT